MYAKLIGKNLKKTDREYKQKLIEEKIISSSSYIESHNFDSISPGDLESMFYLYDKYFFENFFRNNKKLKLKFRLSKRMTSSGGKTLKKRCNGKIEYEICLSSFLLFNSFQNGQKTVIVNGVECSTRLKAALRIMEHEIIHLLEMIIFNDSSCGKRRFKNIVYNYFGHTDVKHQLKTPRETAFREMDLRNGDYVKFSYDGVTKRGQIHRITKRATVMVKDYRGQYCDCEGNRYSKYYVPLHILEKYTPSFLKKNKKRKR